MKNIMAERLRELRRKNGYTQKYIALTIDVAQSIVSQWENDTTENARIPSRDNLIKLSELYGVSVDYLLGGTNNNYDENGIEKLSFDEMRLIDDYRSLNAQGKESVRQFVYMALAVYKKSSDLPGVERATS